mmetsp:Transcript_72158/g.188189  ORF Transcript_72158/g.188189 Transcript_72158/m.188189 type:complete len:246 (+) Transcript_72158:215-952(+)
MPCRAAPEGPPARAHSCKGRRFRLRSWTVPPLCAHSASTHRAEEEGKGKLQENSRGSLEAHSMGFETLSLRLEGALCPKSVHQSARLKISTVRPCMAGLPATLRPPRSQLHCDMMTKARTSVCTQERPRRAEALGSARKSNDSIIVSIRACRWFKPQLPVEQRNDVEILWPAFTSAPWRKAQKCRGSKRYTDATDARASQSAEATVQWATHQGRNGTDHIWTSMCPQIKTFSNFLLARRGATTDI